MKTRIIYFDEQEYNRQLEILKDMIKVVNDYNNSNPIIALNVDDIKEINRNSTQFKNKIYLRRLEQICEQFGADFDTCKIFPNSVEAPYKMFVDMANKQCQSLYKICREIDKARVKTDSQFLDNIKQDQEGKYYLDERGLKEYLTAKTETEQENKLLDMAIKLQSIYKQFYDMGIRKTELDSLLNYYSDLSVRAGQLKVLAK